MQERSRVRKRCASVIESSEEMCKNPKVRDSDVDVQMRSEKRGEKCRRIWTERMEGKFSMRRTWTLPPLCLRLGWSCDD